MSDSRILQPLTDCEPEIGRWLWALEDTRQRTKGVLHNIHLALIDWSSPCIDNTIGTLLYHIAAIEMSYLYEDVLGVGWASELEPLILYEVRDSEGRLVVVQGESLEQHFARLDACRQLLLETYRKMTADEYRRIRAVEDYEITPEWVLHHLIQHESEHRGQIMEARRLGEKEL